MTAIADGLGRPRLLEIVLADEGAGFSPHGDFNPARGRGGANAFLRINRACNN
jgi:hypothetical protein